jgi:hypothetical protein
MARPTKRSRRTKAEINDLCDEMYSIVAADYPATVRQVYYQLVSRGLIKKTESEYKNMVVRLLTKMRMAGELPFGWIADNTRWMRKPTTDGSLGALLSRTAETFRRDFWSTQDAYVEIWLEKEALAGVLVQITDPWDVPLMVTRGYSSITFLHSAAAQIRNVKKPTYLYYFGDHDPSGKDISRNVRERISEFAPDADVTFERIAVTPEQIIKWELPTRPTKKSDTRSNGFKGESVEVDAIPPRVLRALADECITRHVDDDEYGRMLVEQEAGRATLAVLAAAYSD